MSGGGYRNYSYSSNSPVASSSDSQTLEQSSTPVVDVPTAVQNLLLSTKRLQEVLRLWSVSQVSEDEVSDVYVHLGNEFNMMITAFARHKIDMSDVYAVPSQLRAVLEQCLAEDASPVALQIYMPNVRQILYDLFLGLKNKQSEYWSVVGGRRQ